MATHPIARNGKFFLFVRRPKGALGPTVVYAVTLPRDTPAVLAWAPVSLGGIINAPRDLEHEQASMQTAAHEALDRLSTRLGKDFDLLAFMTDELAFREVSVEGLPALFMEALNARPKDWFEAVRAADAHYAGVCELARLESPHLPWDEDITKEEGAVQHGIALRHYGVTDLHNLDNAHLAILNDEIERPQRLLLHVCCGPDAGGVIRQLREEYELVLFWYDPNIQPLEEHDKRLEAFIEVAELEGVAYVIGEYDVDRFHSKIKGLEHTPEQGAKCSGCYDLRLEEAAKVARDLGCDIYTSTLAISPHKVQEKLKAFGALNEKKYGIPYLARNFMKEDGFRDSVTYSREHKVFRQDYCGCWYSLWEGGRRARETAAKLGLTQPELEQDSREPSRKARYERLEEDYKQARDSGEIPAPGNANDDPEDKGHWG